MKHPFLKLALPRPFARRVEAPVAGLRVVPADAQPAAKYDAVQLHYASRTLRPWAGEGVEKPWRNLVSACGGDRRVAIDVLRFVERQAVQQAERVLASAGLGDGGWR
jgi:hypothetical protein